MKKSAKRAALFILLVLLLAAQISSVSAAQPKNDFGYLRCWTAAKMGITIDERKPLPELVLLTEDELQLLVEKKLNISLTINRDGITVRFIVYGFYFPPERTIYVKSDVTGKECLDGYIVHELVHYFQHVYGGWEYSSPEREAEAREIEKDFCRERDFSAGTKCHLSFEIRR